MRIRYVFAAVAVVSIILAGRLPAGFSQETPAAPGDGTLAPAAPEDGTLAPAAPEETDAAAPAGDQAKGQNGQPTTRSGRRPPWPDWAMPVLLFGGLALLWFWMGRGRRKEQHRRKEMLESLKKGDKVTSIGGVIGTIVEVKGSEITVKVDESSNVRMKFARWAIRGLGEAGKAENADKRS